MYEVVVGRFYGALLILLVFLPFALLRPNKSDSWLLVPAIFILSIIYGNIVSVGDRLYYDNFCLYSNGDLLSYLAAYEYNFVYKIISFIPCYFSFLFDIRFSFLFDIFLGIALSITIFIRKIPNYLVLFLITSSFIVCFVATFRLSLAYLLVIIFFYDIDEKKLFSYSKNIAIIVSHISAIIISFPLILSNINFKDIFIEYKIKKNNLIYIFLLIGLIFLLLRFNIINFALLIGKFLERFNSTDSGSTGLKSLLIIFISFLSLRKKEISWKFRNYLKTIIFLSSILIFFNSIARLNGFLLVISSLIFVKYGTNFSGIKYYQILNIFSLIFLGLEFSLSLPYL